MESHPPHLPATAPTPLELLQACAQSSPQLWFPVDYCQQQGQDRALLEEPLWVLRQAELIHVADWVKDRGQGFCLTPAGRQVLLESNPTQALEVARTTRPEPPTNDSADDDDFADSEEAEPTVYDRGETTRQAFFGPKTPIVTLIFLWLNIFWFLVCWTQASKDNLSTADFLKAPTGSFLVRMGAAFGPAIYFGDWWRLLSSAWVHVGLVHLLLNTLALYSIGPVVETLFGRWRVALLYIACALGGSCVAMGLNPMVALAGASGAVWGLMVAVLVWLIRFRSHLPPDLAAENLQQLLVVLTINALLSFAPNISWEGHLGGAISGVVVSIALYYLVPGKRLQRQLLAVLVLVLYLLALVGFLWTMSHYSARWAPVRDVRTFSGVQVQVDQVLQRVNSVAYPNIQVAHQEAIFAMITRQPSQLNAVRGKVQRLDSDLMLLLKDFGKSDAPETRPYREYLTQARSFLKDLDSQLHLSRVPSSEQSQHLGAELVKLKQFWTAAVQSQKQP